MNKYLWERQTSLAQPGVSRQEERKIVELTKKASVVTLKTFHLKRKKVRSR